MDTTERITDRQLEVARLVAEGRSNPEIAEALGVSLAGAKYHVSELLGRLGVSSREEIAEWYRLHGRTEAPRSGWRRFARILAPLGVVAGAGVGATVIWVALAGGRDASGVPAATPAPPATATEPTRAHAASDLLTTSPRIPLFWEYQVQPGDTAESITQSFGVSVQTLVWNNVDLDALLAEGPSDRLELIFQPGTTIVVPAIDGILHEVQADETVTEIAERYRADWRDIVEFQANGLSGDSNDVQPGSIILVPGGTRTLPRPSSATTDAWTWPVEGDVTAGFSPAHPEGIDILAPLDTDVRAARTGRVTFAGGDPCCDDGYHVIIEHDDGYTSLYAHLGGSRVEPGQSVDQGEVIGTVGMTGTADEPHLHFEIRRGDTYQDPLSFLP